MKTLTPQQIEHVSGGLSLATGNLSVGKNLSVLLSTSGSGRLGSLLGAVLLPVSTPELVGVEPIKLSA